MMHIPTYRVPFTAVNERLVTILQRTATVQVLYSGVPKHVNQLIDSGIPPFDGPLT
jgi:hypothetical protein